MDITMMPNKAMFLLILLLQFEKAVAIHAEIEELIEQQQQQQQQQDIVITTEALTKSETQNIVIAKEIFPIKNLDVHGDPGTESVCKYRGECGGSRHGPCPEGSSCENIPGIQVGWCCQTEPQTSQPLTTQQISNRTKSNILVEKRNGKQINKLFRPFKAVPMIHTLSQTLSGQANPPVNSQESYTHSDLRSQCNGTPVGNCGGGLKEKCPPHSKCSFVNKVTGTGICCRTRPSCLYGYTGTCSRFSGKQCRAGTMCKYLPGSKTGWCCYKGPEKAFCPSGEVGNPCSSFQPCNTGSECRYGFCCRMKSCPNKWVNEGSCNINPGAPICPKGTKCINGSCCRLPEAVCPSGIIESSCSLSKPCRQGYVCRFGNCCRV